MSEFTNRHVTPWGYIADASALPDFITSQEFSNFTNNKFGNDARIAPSIPSASESIRNYCGWHVAPSLACGVFCNVHELKASYSGADVLLQLPATFVSEIIRIVVGASYDAITGEYDGEEIEPCNADIIGGGLIRIYDVGARCKRCKIFIKYRAGYELASVNTIKELTANRVTHAVANSYGVNSETAGGVSVSYSALWASGNGAGALSNDSREILDFYRVKGVY